MTIFDVSTLCGEKEKSWYYAHCRSWRAECRAYAMRNKFGTFFFSDNELIAFVPTHKKCAQAYRNHLFIIKNKYGSRLLDKHLNLIYPDKSVRSNEAAFLDFFEDAVRRPANA